ncbi:hypothetical protein [Microbacterium marmarense]|uniref:Uncharacterized protein n=1 Tax=Microbacterium marmarense TaxID=3122051 RepID=A0ABU8LSJ1_9MICO
MPVTEQDQLQTRIAVTTATGVEVFAFDDDELTLLSTFDVAEGSRAESGAGSRYVYLVDYEGGQTTLLDTGTYAEPHGDHDHYYTVEPTLVEQTIDGTSPVHVVGNDDGLVAIFDDGEGSITTLSEATISEGGFETNLFETNAPHHGVAVPLEDQLLITETPDGGLPDTVVQVAIDGSEVARYDEVCPGLHGEATTDGVALFGCTDFVAVIDTDEHTTSTVAYPDGAGDNRVGSFYAGEPMIGNWGTDQLLALNLESGTTSTISVGADIGAVARLGSDVAVLTTDGVLSMLTADGEVISSTEVIDPFALPEGHAMELPTIAVAGDNVIIADFHGEHLVIFDAHDSSVLATQALDQAPTGVVVTGAAGAHEH